MWRPNASMNYWDKLPNDIQDEVLEVRAALTLQRNWRRHPALRSTCLAKGVMEGEYGIEIVCPWTAAALEYCAEHSGMGDPVFWSNLCLELFETLIEYQYASDMGHGWIDRCNNAFNILINKYSEIWWRDGILAAEVLDKISEFQNNTVVSVLL